MDCFGDLAIRTLPVLCLLALAAAAAEEDINPYPRPLIQMDVVHTWSFDRGTEGWEPTHDCKVSARGGALLIQSTGGDPYLVGPSFKHQAPLAVKLRMRSTAAGGGQIFYVTARSGNWEERKSAHFALTHDRQWHDYTVLLDATGTVTRLRLDPGSAPGAIEIATIALVRAMHHPLEIVRLETGDREIAALVRNHSDKALAFTLNGVKASAAASATQRVVVPVPGEKPFEAVRLALTAKGLPPVERTVFLHRPQAQTEWLTLRSKTLSVLAAPDASGARLEQDGRTVAILCPVVHHDGVVPPVQASKKDGRLRFEGKGIAATLALRDDEVAVSIESKEPCEGPVLRALGSLEQGLFAGLEYLGEGERSSSKKDIETAEHLRFAPDPMKVTLPLMACRTALVVPPSGGPGDGRPAEEDRLKAELQTTVAMTWEDMALQPIYAVPNFFDGTPDHRMALRGRTIQATVVVSRAPHVEEAVPWAVQQHGGLPDPPKPPRTRAKQWELCLKSLNGPVKGEGGWAHCAEARWQRRPYADHASTLWRLTGEVPDLPTLVPGGAHVPNDAIYFVTGRAEEWLQVRRGQAKGLIKQQQPDGSFRYKGKYLQGHFEDTASGYCARPAAILLEFAWLTGDKEARAAGEKTLEYMKRFRTPRGAQTWELSLHTPDVLAAAYLVWAYTRGYQLTGKQDYLAEARRWALSGVPFVYLWSNKPVMLYASPPVYGATNWRAPNWMGRPVQWCGGVYAYALALLAPHEKTLDWAKLARGILVAAEQMQYPDGKFVGCLPDAFDLRAQSRHPWNINPCALVSLRLVLDGEVDSLAAAAHGERRVLAPFPVEIRGGQARIRARQGVLYQALVDGERILTIESKGTDVVPLE